MNARTLAALGAAALLTLPAVPARATTDDLVLRGTGAGTATLNLPRVVVVDLYSLRFTGCGQYAGVTFYTTPDPVTALRITPVEHAVPGTLGISVFGDTSNGRLTLEPGTYRVALHGTGECAVALRTRGLRAPWVTTVTAGAAETFATAGLTAPASGVGETAQQWPLASPATTTTYVVAGGASHTVNGSGVGTPELQACAGPAPQVCLSPDEGMVSVVVGPGWMGRIVASQYRPGKIDPRLETWASARMAGAYDAGAVAVLTTAL